MSDNASHTAPQSAPLITPPSAPLGAPVYITRPVQYSVVEFLGITPTPVSNFVDPAWFSHHPAWLLSAVALGKISRRAEHDFELTVFQERGNPKTYEITGLRPGHVLFTQSPFGKVIEVLPRYAFDARYVLQSFPSGVIETNPDRKQVQTLADSHLANRLAKEAE